jgi:hypothetical protein
VRGPQECGGGDDLRAAKMFDRQHVLVLGHDKAGADLVGEIEQLVVRRIGANSVAAGDGDESRNRAELTRKFSLICALR